MSNEIIAHERGIIGWLGDVLSILEPNRVPKRTDLCLAVSAKKPPESVVLVLVFGSVARLKPAKDLDLILVTDCMDDGCHEYVRLKLSEISVDLNIVSRSWLRQAYLELEHSYWLSESFPVCIADEECLLDWIRAANSYWKISSVARRRQQFSDLARAFASISSTAREMQLGLIARWAAHEASRIVACDLLDREGAPTHSNDQLFGAFANGATRRNLSNDRAEQFIRLMRWDSGSDTDFLELRRAISAFRRGRALELLGETSLRTHVELGQALQRVLVLNGSILERQMREDGLDRVLPKEHIPEDPVSQFLTAPPTDTSYPNSRISRQSPTTPVQGGVTGARWVERRGEQLKVIINTGGCKTPSCRFCSLPEFARNLDRRAPALVLREAAQAARMTKLSLYNDGNLLNPAELSPTQLRALCDEVSRLDVQSLTIESTPRFVRSKILESIRDWTGVSQLVVAMGFQTSSNIVAVSALGRPDSNPVFEFAIEEVRCAGATVRLYLLHGFGATREVWDRRLTDSIRWAIERDVARVSVCPYIPPNDPRVPVSEIDRLRDLIFRQDFPSTTMIELVDAGMRSCGGEVK